MPKPASRKRLLVITASAMQEPIIKGAQSMGFDVVATDRSADAPGLKIANYSEVVDTVDFERVLAVAKKYKVAGVLAEQTDIAVPTAAYVAEKMGLPGIGY